MSLSQGSRCLSCQHGHDLEVLLPHLAGAVVERVELAGTLLCIRACARVDSAVCPACGGSSRRVHSRYERRLADAAIGGRRVVIRLQVRRLFCDDPACAKTTFAEQVPGLTVRYGRKTALLAEVLRNIAVALAGRAGCRLAQALHVAASRPAPRDGARVTGRRARDAGDRPPSGLGRHTVQCYAHAKTWQELVDGRWQAPRASMLDPFKPHLHQRMGEDCGNFAQLFREISSRGYTGSYSTVRDYLEQHRPAKAPLPPAPPTVRDVTGWLTRHPDSLTEDEQPQLKALLERCPELHAASGHVRTFARMLTQLTGQNLPRWISDARAAELPGISSFAKGPGQDLDAVTQGLTTRWNSGPVEGRVNHIKMIKRQMYGRAKPDLLRKRVLLAD